MKLRHHHLHRVLAEALLSNDQPVVLLMSFGIEILLERSIDWEVGGTKLLFVLIPNVLDLLECEVELDVLFVGDFCSLYLHQLAGSIVLGWNDLD